MMVLNIIQICFVKNLDTPASISKSCVTAATNIVAGFESDLKVSSVEGRVFNQTPVESVVGNIILRLWITHCQVLGLIRERFCYMRGGEQA
jgi:hypothetical protein